jgi:hypothetical protein
MPISLKTFCQQYLDEFEQGAAQAALAEHATQDRAVGEWRSLWARALSRAVQ